MPINLKYNEKLKYLIISINGNVTVEEAASSMEEICNSDIMPSNVNSLMDVRGLLFDNIDIDFIKRLVLVRKKYNEARGEAKIALLSDSIIASPIVKLYTILSIDLIQKTKVFKSIEEAELWLCEDLLNSSPV